jgi:aspartyl-tRNA(Asn)/glutamyl-tRNA(Gln) amidotransferase subunit C
VPDAPRIQPEDVEHVARLARLALSDDEKERMRQQLDRILGYIAKLNELDTEGVEPTSHAVRLVNVMRDDEVRPSLPAEVMLANAPERAGELFRVPRIIED